MGRALNACPECLLTHSVFNAMRAAGITFLKKIMPNPPSPIGPIRAHKAGTDCRRSRVTADRPVAKGQVSGA